MDKRLCFPHGRRRVTMSSKLIDFEAREDDEGDESPNEEMETTAQRRAIQRKRRSEDDIVATAQCAAIDCYVDIWGKQPEDLGMLDDTYQNILKLLRRTSEQTTVSSDVVDALLDNDKLENKLVALIPLIGDCEIACDGSQNIQVFIDVIWDWFSDIKVHLWLDWACDVEFHEETPISYSRFHRTLQNLCDKYTDKPLVQDDIINAIRYNLPTDFPVYKKSKKPIGQYPPPRDVRKWVRPVRRKSSPRPMQVSVREAEWYRDVVPYSDKEHGIGGTQNNKKKRKPHWHVRLFLKSPLPGVNPWHQRPDPEEDVTKDVTKMRRRNWVMTKHLPITYISHT